MRASIMCILRSPVKSPSWEDKGRSHNTIPQSTRYDYVRVCIMYVTSENLDLGSMWTQTFITGMAGTAFKDTPSVTNRATDRFHGVGKCGVLD